jgi:hypothetical protein
VARLDVAGEKFEIDAVTRDANLVLQQQYKVAMLLHRPTNLPVSLSEVSLALALKHRPRQPVAPRRTATNTSVASWVKEHGVGFDRELRILESFRQALDRGVTRLPEPLRRQAVLQMLAVTAAAQHFTASLAADVLANNTWQESGVDDDALDLWLWHTAEEVEHRHVRFRRVHAPRSGDAGPVAVATSRCQRTCGTRVLAAPRALGRAPLLPTEASPLPVAQIAHRRARRSCDRTAGAGPSGCAAQFGAIDLAFSFARRPT